MTSGEQQVHNGRGAHKIGGNRRHLQRATSCSGWTKPSSNQITKQERATADHARASLSPIGLRAMRVPPVKVLRNEVEKVEWCECSATCLLRTCSAFSFSDDDDVRTSWARLAQVAVERTGALVSARHLDGQQIPLSFARLLALLMAAGRQNNGLPNCICQLSPASHLFG
ncbi:hypothetical protein PoB_001253800 [Plakobranchus ocellatus]|uniref:Uncharacterized protein n=1 Tax=Plakobranchus ocellatus TaxID=259542 RepID=A0AAV3YUY0_9GAST|nr:hypothetical protein PoB_001253800 [Plakobranchus ocellatus]